MIFGGPEGPPELIVGRSGRPAGVRPNAFLTDLLAAYGFTSSGYEAVVKQVIAVVRPSLAERVIESLSRAPLEACTVREVKGYGRQKSYLDQYGDSEYALAFLPKVEITCWVEDARVGEVIDRIQAFARSGRMGDGKIFVIPDVSCVLCPDSLSSIISAG